MTNDEIINEITTELDKLPTSRTQYEFENFHVESYPTQARQLIAVMKEIERLRLELFQHSDSQHRSYTELKTELNQALEWYNAIPADTRRVILDNFENQEGQYWAKYLGREAAIEMITIGRTSKETMDKMASLPVSDFEEAVKICVRYASLIKDTTSSVETSLGIITPDLSSN